METTVSPRSALTATSGSIPISERVQLPVTNDEDCARNDFETVTSWAGRAKRGGPRHRPKSRDHN